jgi:1,4-alpha-glucan branching enzyme
VEKGYLSIVLHAHMPFVRHPESEDYLEERWLFEAMTETYIPLLQMFQRLVRDRVDFRITMSVTPTLLTMMTDELLQRRYLNHLHKLIELAEKEVERTENMPEFHDLAKLYLEQFQGILYFYVHSRCNVVDAFRELQDYGYLELITSCATHAFLPLLMTEEAIRAQIATAISLHERHFGKKPKGIWLPECGFVPDLDRVLKDYGIQFFFVDAKGVSTAKPKPIFGTYSPVLTPHGIAAFPRDEESSKQVWSSDEGYPGDFDYREYYRDIGFDLDFETVRPYIHPKGIRVNTGIKYFRITGKGDEKQPYQPTWARAKAAEHAGNFLLNRTRQVEYWSSQLGRKPIIVSPYDAELFGHWWFEGPIFLEMLFRKLHFDQDVIKPVTPTEYLQQYADYQVCELQMSSWGRDGYADVWIRGENDWIYPALHMAEKRMNKMANHFYQPSFPEQRALNQAARELMLAESSDWAFIMDSHTMVDYAVKRTKYHVNRFTHLYNMLQDGEIDASWLGELEQTDNIFPDIDYQVYRSFQLPNQSVLSGKSAGSGRPRILLLSWEFPPRTVGGLSRHVYDLTRYLARNGCEVHVLTTEVPGNPDNEVVEGVHVHRVHALVPDGGEFIHWVFQLNLAMIETCQALVDSGLHFDLIHAHDWLVGDAAKTLKVMLGVPVVATIHATEHGRNHGIHTELQRSIHEEEWRLTYEASRVIVCSSYMQGEVREVFSLPLDKIDVVPNGIDPDLLSIHGSELTLGKHAYALDSEQIVLYIGRLVREKGVHVLLAAVPFILEEFPNAKFVIVGKGPFMNDLQRQAETLGIKEHVLFTGFVDDEGRNQLLHLAKVAVFPSLYEPFGIVALEAMATGLSVVASDVGGLADVVDHGQNGLKIYPNDAYSLATQVKQVLRNPEWAKEMQHKALQDISKYDWNRIAMRTIDIYHLVLGDSDGEVNPRELAATGRVESHE